MQSKQVRLTFQLKVAQQAMQVTVNSPAAAFTGGFCTALCRKVLHVSHRHEIAVLYDHAHRTQLAGVPCNRPQNRDSSRIFDAVFLEPTSVCALWRPRRIEVMLPRVVQVLGVARLNGFAAAEIDSQLKDDAIGLVLFGIVHRFPASNASLYMLRYKAVRAKAALTQLLTRELQ